MSRTDDADRPSLPFPAPAMSTGSKVGVLLGVMAGGFGAFMLLRAIAGSSAGGDLPQESELPVPGGEGQRVLLRLGDDGG